MRCFVRSDKCNDVILCKTYWFLFFALRHTITKSMADGKYIIIFKIYIEIRIGIGFSPRRVLTADYGYGLYLHGYRP